jgi:hypothetical protein
MSNATNAAIFALCAALPSTAIAADNDACDFLTSAQVSAAVGVAVGQGTHVTPSFVKTCTWAPADKSKVSAVTLNLQTAAVYDAGKRQAAMGAALNKDVAMKSASVGDDAYYFAIGDQVGLLVKKGGVSFKAAVYAKIPVADKEAMELKLARAVAARL